MANYDYRIAAGTNIALGSLTNIETIKPSGDSFFFDAPIAQANYSPGTMRIRMDCLVYIGGYPSQKWVFSKLTDKQYNYLMTTYCAGGYSGNVTVYTRLANTTYVRYNAVLIVPDASTLRARIGATRIVTYEDAAIQLTKMYVAT